MSRKTNAESDGWETVPVRGGRPSEATSSSAAGASASSTGVDATTSTHPEGQTAAPGSTNAAAAAREQNRSTATSSDSGGLVYVYTQLYCGLCGRFVTDIGGLVTAHFAADISNGKQPSPGTDMLRRLPDCFTQEPRSGVEPEKGPHGLRGAVNLMDPVTMRRDSILPKLFLQTWLCFH